MCVRHCTQVLAQLVSCAKFAMDLRASNQIVLHLPQSEDVRNYAHRAFSLKRKIPGVWQSG